MSEEIAFCPGCGSRVDVQENYIEDRYFAECPEHGTVLIAYTMDGERYE